MSLEKNGINRSMENTSGLNYWLFQYVPGTETGNRVGNFKEGDEILWRITKYKKKFQAGDVVYIWRARKEGGLEGWGHIKSNEFVKQIAKGETVREIDMLPVIFSAKFSKPISRSDVKTALKEIDFPFFRNAQGTNHPVSYSAAQVLNSLIRRNNYSAPPEPPADRPEETKHSEPEEEILSNEAIIRSDTPAIDDQLGRKPFAQAVAAWLNRLWRDMNKARRSTGNSFVVQLYGEWGSGKTTFISLLKRSIKKESHTDKEKKERVIGGKAARNNWITIDFNAWLHQHIKPEWWSLMEQIFRQALIKENGLPFLKRLRLMVYWRRCRLVDSYGPTILVGMCMILAGIVIGQLNVASDGNGWAAIIKQSAEVLKCVGIIGSAAIFLLHLLLSGSSSSALVFQKCASDPMKRVSFRFEAFITKLNTPVMVFIDDLDRCHSEYVVRLLESLQTIFNYSRVFYLVAADRRWISACFESKYDDLGASVNEMGRPTGYLFLEKLFQLSISVPFINPGVKKSYIEHLVLQKTSTEEEELERRENELKNAIKEAESEFEKIKNEGELYEKLEEKTGEFTKDQARVAAAIVRSSSEEMDRAREHRLTRFVELMEPNPRAIKLLVTAYGVYVAHAMASGVRNFHESFLDQIVLWTIISLRFPQLAEYLERYPDNLSKFAQNTRPRDIDEEIWNLAKSSKIERILSGRDIECPETGEPIDEPLDGATLEILVGKRSAENSE